MEFGAEVRRQLRLKRAVPPSTHTHTNKLVQLRRGLLYLAAEDLYTIDRSGAAYYGEHIGAVAARLKALGAAAGVYGDRVYTREDWRLSPPEALAAPPLQRPWQRLA